MLGRDLQGYLVQLPPQSWANTRVRLVYLRALCSQAAWCLWVTCLIIFPVIFLSHVLCFYQPPLSVSAAEDEKPPGFHLLPSAGEVSPIRLLAIKR